MYYFACSVCDISIPFPNNGYTTPIEVLCKSFDAFSAKVGIYQDI